MTRQQTSLPPALLPWLLLLPKTLLHLLLLPPLPC
jgi:hypothetical protein